MNKFIEVAIVAKRLNVSPSTVYRLIKKNKLNAITAGVSAGIRVDRKSLEKFEEERRILIFDEVVT